MEALTPALAAGVADPRENPRHAGLERWMAVHGYQIVSKPENWFDRCEDERD